MKTLNKYIGRIVRLNQATFREVARQARGQENTLENCFLVAEASREMRKLICYGGNLRITVGASEVALI